MILTPIPWHSHWPIKCDSISTFLEPQRYIHLTLPQSTDVAHILRHINEKAVWNFRIVMKDKYLADQMTFPILPGEKKDNWKEVSRLFVLQQKALMYPREKKSERQTFSFALTFLSYTVKASHNMKRNEPAGRVQP